MARIVALRMHDARRDLLNISSGPMTITEILDSGSIYKKLTRIQKANYEYSLSWKENGYNLLKDAKDEKEFSEAVLWCGITGNVSRTVAKRSFKEFSNYLFNKRQEILEGNYSLLKVKEFDNKKPISYISKVCHILNPHGYPLIYDSYVRDAVNITTLEEFNKLLVNLRKKS